MNRAAIIVALVVICSLSQCEGEGRTKRSSRTKRQTPDRSGPPKFKTPPFRHPLHLSCMKQNKTDNTFVYNTNLKDTPKCGECNVGPITYEYCDGNTMVDAWFCDKLQPSLIRTACKLRSADPDATHQFRRDVKCKGGPDEDLCVLGPLSLVTMINQEVNATFCCPEKPQTACIPNLDGESGGFNDPRESERRKQTPKTRTAPPSTADIERMAAEIGFGKRGFNDDDDTIKEPKINPDEEDDEEEEERWTPQVERDRKALSEKWKEIKKKRAEARVSEEERELWIQKKERFTPSETSP